MKVLVIHRNEAQAAWMAGRVLADLRARDIETVMHESGHMHSALLKNCALMIVLGGDGTILDCARLAAGSNTAVLGVNFGQAGFLSGIEPEDWPLAMERLLDYRYTVERRSLLEAHLFREGQVRRLGQALNDVVIRSQVLHIICLKLSVDGHSYGTYRSDGIIFATPTGSTAYSYSAGGPILSPGLGAIVVNPVCPQLACTRALVVGDGSLLELEVDSDYGAGISLDGRKEMDLARGDRILIKKADQNVMFVQLNPLSSMKKIRHCHGRLQ